MRDDDELARIRQHIAIAVAATQAGMKISLEEGLTLEAQLLLLDEVLRLRARERPLLVLLRAVATGEPLPPNFVHQARVWLQAEEATR